MSFRGRGGRGGGRGGRGGRGGGRGYGASNYSFQAKHGPHEDFPEITLPDMTCAKATNDEKALIVSTLKLEEFMRNSCYHLEMDAPKKKNDDKEIERYSDRKRKSHSKREALKSYLKLNPGNFPAELLEGFKQVQPSSKKLRWDKDSDERTFEVFEKLEEKHKAGGGENKTEKDDEEEDNEDEEEVEEEESSDDDYNQNIEFDDDDDDWNQEEEAHEDCYD